MPIYEFQCQSCGTIFDNLQKVSDPDPSACPNCEQPRITRRVTAPAFRLAGSGWYETDFKKDGDKKRNLAGEGTGAGESKKVETATVKNETASAPAGSGSTPSPSGGT